MSLLNDIKAAQGLPVPIPRGQFKEPSWVGGLSSPYERDRGVRHPLDYATVQERYGQHPWVYQAVFVIANKLSEVPIRLFKRAGKEVQEIEEHESLVLLDSPNPYQTMQTLTEAIVSHLELSGNAYVQKVRDKTGKGPVTELWPIRSDRVLIVPGNDRLIMGYLVKVGGEYYALPAEDVIHFKYFSPFNDFYGMGPLQAARTGLITDLYAMEYNKLFFINSGRPDGVLSTEQDIDQPDADRLRELWRESLGGYQRSHRIAVLGKGAKYQQIGLSQGDMEFIELRKMTREELLGVFGVPPAMVGLFEYANYANADKQEEIFYQLTALPRLGRLQQMWTKGILREWEDDSLFYEYDISGIKALQDELSTDANVGEVLIRSAQWTPNEVRSELWKRPPVDKGGDELYLSGGLLPIGTLSDEAKSLQAGRRKTLRATIRSKVEEIRWQEGLSFWKAIENDPSLVTDLEPGVDYQELKSEGQEDLERRRRDEVWKSFLKKVNPYTLEYTKKMQFWFRDQKERFVEAVLALEPPKSAEKDSAPVFSPQSAMPSEEAERRLLEALLLKIGTDLVNRAGNEVLSELGIGISFNLLDPEVVRFLEEDKSEGLAKVLEKETRERIEATLSEGIQARETTRELADRIRKEFNQMSRVRAVRIARTETTAAYNFAKHEAFNQSPSVEKQEWISSRDPDVRDSHQIDGQVRGKAERFSNGLLYPGEPGQPASEVVNCRCTISPVVSRQP